MKYRTTNKEVKAGHVAVLKIGYCDACDLLWAQEPAAYTAGVYGWNADIYELPGSVAICTGYRPIGQNVDYDLLYKYNDEARAIATDYNKPFAERKEAVNALLLDFVKVARVQ